MTGASALQDLKAAAFDAGADPALLFDAQGAMLSANEAAEALFGQSLAGLARSGLGGASLAGSELAALVGRCATGGGRVHERSLRVELPGGATFMADGSAVRLDGDSLLLTLSVQPVAETSERAQEGMVAAGGLGRMLAHEIKNPLAGIRGAAQLLEAGLSAADRPLAQLIVDETERIRRLVDRMEAFALDATPKCSPVNIHRVLARVRALTANGVADGLAIREDFDPSLPFAFADEDQMVQVFLNLTKNAAEAARSRADGLGEIAMATAFRHGARVQRDPAIPARAAPLEIRIGDNGPGVSPAVRAHLFEPFVTTKAHGTGLGLAVVAKLVAGHGGLVEFSSSPGRTEFRVLLPAAPAPGAAP